MRFTNTSCCCGAFDVISVCRSVIWHHFIFIYDDWTKSGASDNIVVASHVYDTCILNECFIKAMPAEKLNMFIYIYIYIYILLVWTLSTFLYNKFYSVVFMFEEL